MLLRVLFGLVATSTLAAGFVPCIVNLGPLAAGRSSCSPPPSTPGLLLAGCDQGQRPIARKLPRAAAKMRRSAASASAGPDPFRPARHPIDPVAINVLQKALFAKAGTTPGGASGAGASAGAVEAAARLEAFLGDARQRRVEGEANAAERLSLEEWATIERRVRAVVALQPQLEAALLAATNAHPWIAKYKSGGDFGLPLDGAPPASALVALNRSECLLALWMLHVGESSSVPGNGGEGEALAVRFLDDDRLEVLRHPSAKAALFTGAN